MKPPIRRKPRTPDKLPAKPNREALLTAQKMVDAQLSVDDGANHAAGLARTEPTETAALGADFTPIGTLEERHEQRLQWLYSEWARQASNRRLMARDEAMYDSKQWSREDAETLLDRGQDPIVYNEIASVIDWAIGTERRSRVDFFVVAEEEGDEAADDAVNKTKLLKYLDDVNLAPFERSFAAEECFKGGLGILEVGLRGDKTGVPIFIGAESWRNFLHDSRAKKDQSDARYNFRVKEVDLDVAIALFPEKGSALKAASHRGEATKNFRSSYGLVGGMAGLNGFGAFDSDEDDVAHDGGVATPVDFYDARDRVTLIECWSREPMRRPIGQGGLGDPVTFKVRVSIMIESETLLETWSPFKHDRFPFVLMWCYRDKGTGMPYGMARRLYGPQSGLNKRMARAQYEASFSQTAIEKGAIDPEMTIEELQEQRNSAQGFMVFANGALSGNKVKFLDAAGAAREQLMLAETERAGLRSMGGVNEENRGLRSEATSRVAMDAKAERGSIQTTEIFDNLLLARQQEGELTLSLCEQFVTQPMTIRVAGESGPGNYQWTKLNQPDHYDDSGEAVYLNDITKRRSHFVVGEQAWKQSYAESAFDSMMQVMTQLASAAPGVVVALLDVIFDMHPTLPRKKAVIERIRSVNGQTDPDGKVTPEQQKAREQQAAMAKAQFELQMATLRADVAKAEATGQKLSAESIRVRLTAVYEAAQAAQVLALAPQITPIADQLLASAGFQDQGGSAQVIQPQPMAPVPLDGQTATTTQGRMRALAPELQQADGIGVGIETARPDGVQPGVM